VKLARRCAAFWLLIIATSAHAQIQVDLKFKRRLFIAYEPVMATVTITNLTGRTITLRDIDEHKWFAFQVATAEGRLIPPRDPDYSLEPLEIEQGQTVKRRVNLNTLYPISDFGSYRVQASVYFAPLKRYFSSSPHLVEVTEGKLIWQQTAGVPEGHGEGYRLITLLTHRLSRENMLYVRVQDRERGIVYATYPLGRVVMAQQPQAELDRQNRLHVLQMIGPRTYVLSRIGLNGEWLGQQIYTAPKSRPELRKVADGGIEVVGGQVEIRAAQPVEQADDADGVPKLSDRPPGFPVR
jgi:hypothetical protein